MGELSFNTSTYLGHEKNAGSCVNFKYHFLLVLLNNQKESDSQKCQ